MVLCVSRIIKGSFFLLNVLSTWMGEPPWMLLVKVVTEGGHRIWDKLSIFQGLSCLILFHAFAPFPTLIINNRKHIVAQLFIGPYN